MGSGHFNEFLAPIEVEILLRLFAEKDCNGKREIAPKKIKRIF